MGQNLLENLNKEQLEAITHKDGPLLIVAGAGTGKTTVITQRVAYLVEQGLAQTEEILALTFTEKGAGEMTERVDRLLPYGYFDLWISTFHSFAERILGEHGLAIGLPTNFRLLNQFEQWALIKKNFSKFDLDYYRPLGNPTKFISALVKHFSRAKDEDISPSEYLKYAEELKQNLDGMLSGCSVIPAKAGIQKEIAEQEVMRINELANAYHTYQQLLLDNNALDFGDLINYCLKLFRQRPAILANYRQQFKYILLDEFQDTNWAQYELIKLLAAPKNNLVVVADDDQAIFRFRGASMSNILQFKKDYPQSREIILVKNYRSCQNILDLSYRFIKLNNPNRLEWQLNQDKKSKIKNKKLPPKADQPLAENIKSKILNKKLVAEKIGKGETEVIEAETLADEVKLVIEKIIKLKEQDREASWNDFAILVRANDSARDFISHLESLELPYIFAASRGLYTKAVIMDVIAYLKLLDNYHESPSLYRILNLPMFNFSHQELVNFNWWAKKRAWSLYEVLNQAGSLKFAAEVQEKINRVLSLIGRHSAMVKDQRVSQVFLAFMNDSGYAKYLTAQSEAASRQAASLLNQFMRRIQAFEAASDDKTVKAFLEELSLEMEAGEEGALSADLEAGPEAIKILTVHGAKGLEFNYVFITNLVDKRFPTIERSEQIQLPEALIKEILPVGDIHLEEERRLFYVAMTRAKKGVYFSWAKDYGGARDKKPSRFLEELGLAKNGKSVMRHSRPLRQSSGEASENGNLERIFSGSSGTLPHQVRGRSRMTDERGFGAGKLPPYFSYTQLAAFSSCPYQYRFAHILKVPVSGKEQYSFGKTLHNTLQKLFSLIMEKRTSQQADLFGRTKTDQQANPKIELEEVMKLYEENWIDDWYESKSKKQQRFNQGKEILKKFYEKHQASWPMTLFLEKGFNFKLADEEEQYTIRGAIDRIDLVNDLGRDITGHRQDGASKIKIIDYKTGGPKDKLSFGDKEQLLIYQLAAENLFKQQVDSLAVYYLENNSQVDFLGSKSELEKMRQKIITTIKEIKRGQFPAKPSQLCRWCDFNEICEFRQS